VAVTCISFDVARVSRLAKPPPHAVMDRLLRTHVPSGRHTLAAVGDTGLIHMEPQPRSLAAAPPGLAWDQYFMVRFPPAGGGGPQTRGKGALSVQGMGSTTFGTPYTLSLLTPGFPSEGGHRGH
jgi:hypothetical protein